MKRNHIVVVGLISLLFVACSGCASQKAPIAAAATGRTVLRLAEQGSDIEIRLDNVVDLYGLHIHVKFDPAKMQIRDADPDREGIQIAPGDLPAPDFVALNMVDNEHGMLDYAVMQTSPHQPVSGSGVAAVIHVQEGGVEGDPFTVIHVELADPDGNELPVLVGDARGN